MKVSFYPNYSYTNFSAVNHTAKVSFGTNGRSYIDQNGDRIGTQSWLFRGDVDWKRLAAYEKTHFREKKRVNIVQLACADGSESATKIISLLENHPKEDDEKFFPIKAYDIDDEILRAAKSGLLNTATHDRMALQMNADNYEDYFQETSEKLEIENNQDIQNPRTLKITNELKSRVKFEKADMYDVLAELEDNSDTILICRNILGYFEEPKVERFVKMASNKLKQGSLLVIGDHDTLNSQVDNYLRENKFSPVMRNVYQKAA